VDDVHGREVRDDRRVDREVQLVEGVDVVGAVRVVAVEADRVGRGDQAGVAAPEPAVGAGIDGVPLELLRDDVDDRGAVFRRDVDWVFESMRQMCPLPEEATP